MLTIAFIALLLATITAAAHPAPIAGAPRAGTANHPSWQWRYRVWMPAVWQRLALCETRMRWDWNSGTYQGAFGFYHGSWDAFRLPGYPSEAYLATPWQQYRVALAIHARYGFTGWGCYRHAWVRG